MTRIPDELLRILRNNIPIRYVLSEITKQVIRNDRHGRQRFQCFTCKRFDTSINEHSNLAHCFSCNKSCNPIDLVIQRFQVPFKQAVKTLQELLPQFK